MKSSVSLLLGILTSSIAAGPSDAQTTRSYGEDARVAYLRKDVNCVQYIGAFRSLTARDYSPTKEDIALMARIDGLEDRIEYEGDRLADQLGRETAKRVFVEELDRMPNFVGAFAPDPEEARRIVAPHIRDCIQQALVLAKPPK